jgi:hypothetical protein
MDLQINPNKFYTPAFMHQTLGKILSIQKTVQFIYINVSLFENINIFIST